MKTLTREIMMERIETITSGETVTLENPTYDAINNDILSLFIEFGKSLIGEDENEVRRNPGLMDSRLVTFDIEKQNRNQFRSELRQKLEELRGKSQSPLDGTITVDQAKSYYATINGKCAWCGEDAKDLPMSHFEEHERLEKEGGKI